MIILMHRHRKSVNLIRTETHIKVQNSGYRWALCCTYVYVMANTQQKASDDKDCHTSLLSQGGASDLQAYSLYETRTIFCFVTLMLLIHFLHVKINKKWQNNIVTFLPLDSQSSAFLHSEYHFSLPWKFSLAVHLCYTSSCHGPVWNI